MPKNETNKHVICDKIISARKKDNKQIEYEYNFYVQGTKFMHNSKIITICFQYNYFEQLYIGAALMTMHQSKLTTSRVRILDLINKGIKFLAFKTMSNQHWLRNFCNSLLLIFKDSILVQKILNINCY